MRDIEAAAYTHVYVAQHADGTYFVPMSRARTSYVSPAEALTAFARELEEWSPEVQLRGLGLFDGEGRTELEDAMTTAQVDVDNRVDMPAYMHPAPTIACIIDARPRVEASEEEEEEEYDDYYVYNEGDYYDDEEDEEDDDDDEEEDNNDGYYTTNPRDPPTE